MKCMAKKLNVSLLKLVGALLIATSAMFILTNPPNFSSFPSNLTLGANIGLILYLLGVGVLIYAFKGK